MTGWLKQLVLGICDALGEWLDPQRAKDRAAFAQELAQVKAVANEHAAARTLAEQQLRDAQAAYRIVTGEVERLQAWAAKLERERDAHLEELQQRLAAERARSDADVLAGPIGRASTGR